ncbi:aromatic acid exporter family protein [Leuconostocaceae bacterium ESL0723]|nr:aromatic acid exporter family protein [Leuconostocaceae bacterium ESL0723]
MEFSAPRVGLRTLKTGLCVMVIIIAFHFLHRPPFVACLAAVFAMRESWENTLHYSKIRLMSNSVGGSLALVYFLIRQEGHNAPWVSMVVLPILVIITIVVLDSINYNNGVIGGLAALLMISLTIPLGATIDYVFERIVDTFIGVLIAIAINAPGAPRDVEKADD